jgi:CO/xanthine dehydrogenase FAD-binding subunit
VIRFDYLRPRTLKHALEIVATHQDSARPLAGGTDLMIQLRRGTTWTGVDLGPTRLLMDITALPELLDIQQTGDVIRIGAAVRHEAIAASSLLREAVPLLCEAAGKIGSPQIRNLGTIGGNIVNASPAADLVPPLTVLSASVTIASIRGLRELELVSFISGVNRTELALDELVVAVSFTKPAPAARGAFLKIGRRAGLTKARMSCAVVVRPGPDTETIEDIRIACGAVAPAPRRMEMAERILRGQKPSAALLAEAGQAASEQIVLETGVRWSTPYKKPVVAALVRRALEAAWTRN